MFKTYPCMKRRRRDRSSGITVIRGNALPDRIVKRERNCGMIAQLGNIGRQRILIGELPARLPMIVKVLGMVPNPEWPKVKRKRTIAISSEEHAKIIRSELNPGHRRYYQMLWETGGNQSDIANLTWERIDREENLIVFYRDKMDEREEDGELCGLSVLVIGPRLKEILAECPQEGFLFPTLRAWNARHRTTEFARRCRIIERHDKGLDCLPGSGSPTVQDGGVFGTSVHLETIGPVPRGNA